MKAEYDSQADALSIDLIEVQRWDGGEAVDDTYCNIALHEGRATNVELLSPREHLDLLEAVGERYDIDVTVLRAAAQAALAAPDRTVTLDVATRAIA